MGRTSEATSANRQACSKVASSVVTMAIGPVMLSCSRWRTRLARPVTLLAEGRDELFHEHELAVGPGAPVIDCRQEIDHFPRTHLSFGDGDREAFGLRNGPLQRQLPEFPELGFGPQRPIRYRFIYGGQYRQIEGPSDRGGWASSARPGVLGQRSSCACHMNADGREEVADGDSFALTSRTVTLSIAPPAARLRQ